MSKSVSLGESEGHPFCFVGGSTLPHCSGRHTAQFHGHANKQACSAVNKFALQSNKLAVQTNNLTMQTRIGGSRCHPFERFNYFEFQFRL